MEHKLKILIFFTAYSPTADLKLFQKLMPAFSNSVQMMQSYLDLQALWQKLKHTPNFKFPFEGKRLSGFYLIEQ